MLNSGGELIGLKVYRIELYEAELFCSLTIYSLDYAFPVGDMPAYRSVPFSGLDILRHGAFLQINAAEPVYYVQMHDRMQRHGPAMAIFTC